MIDTLLALFLIGTGSWFCAVGWIGLLGILK